MEIFLYYIKSFTLNKFNTLFLFYINRQFNLELNKNNLKKIS